MSKYTEAVLIGYFPDSVFLALSEPLNGVRFRQQGTISPPFVADILTAAFKNVAPDDIVDFVSDAIGDFNAVLVLDDDHSEKSRAVRFTHGIVDSDSGEA